jgi:hypothetical protein
MRKTAVLCLAMLLLGLAATANSQQPRGYRCSFALGTFGYWGMGCCCNAGETELSYSNSELFARNVSCTYCCVRAQLRFPSDFNILAAPYVRFRAKRVTPQDQLVHLEGPFTDGTTWAIEKTVSLTKDYKEFFLDLTADIAAKEASSGKQIRDLFEFLLWLKTGSDDGYYLDDVCLGDSAIAGSTLVHATGERTAASSAATREQDVSSVRIFDQAGRLVSTASPVSCASAVRLVRSESSTSVLYVQTTMRNGATVTSVIPAVQISSLTSVMPH